MPTALIGPAISTGISLLGSSLASKGKKSPTAGLQNFQPFGFSGGGLQSDRNGNNISVTASRGRTDLVNRISGTLGTQADELAALRGRVAPGISELRASRLAEIENARRRAVGDLRENLQRRRVLGSSFGQDAITRAESEFAGQQDRVAAESFLQELESTNQLLQQEFGARRASFQTGLDELNLEAELASKLAAGATDQLGANARLEAQLLAKEAEGEGKFFGQALQPFAKAAGEGAGSLFSSASGGNAFLPSAAFMSNSWGW